MAAVHAFRVARQDCLFLAGVVLASQLRYLAAPGFYSDDWAFLGAFATSADPSVAGLFAAANSPVHHMRPGQLLLMASLYRAFGLAPLGYHLFNGAVVAGIGGLVYLLARECRQPRIVALSIALLYATLPSWSTDRFWYAAFMINVSMGGFLASAIADLRALRAESVRSALAWKLGSVAALLASVACYEVCLPLFAMTLPWMVFARWHESGWRGVAERLPRIAMLFGVTLVLLAGAINFKMHTTTRLGAGDGIRAQVAHIVREAARTDLPEHSYGLNAAHALRVHFVTYGVGLPGTLARAAKSECSGASVGLAAAFSAAVLAYLFRASASGWPRPRAWLLLPASGLVLFALGYAVFVTNYNVQFTAAGIANRTAIAAALGSAVLLTGLIGSLCSVLPSPALSRAGFVGVVSAWAGASFFLLNVIGASWVEAYARARGVLDRIERTLPVLAPNSALVLEGVCPYVGPAIVFEAPWDLAGALRVRYRDPSLRATVVTTSLQAEDHALRSTLYGSISETYEYSENLLLFDAASGRVSRLTSAAMARPHLGDATGRSSLACPRGEAGMGARLF